MPVHDTISIVKDLLIEGEKLNHKQIDELILLLNVLLKQNYFTFNNNFYLQEFGLAMGSPLSGLLADLYLHHFENTYMFSENNKFCNNIKFYARYVDDTFIIFNGTLRQIEKLKHYLNSLSKNIQFTLETEVDNKLNFLDLTVTKYLNKFQYKI